MLKSGHPFKCVAEALKVDAKSRINITKALLLQKDVLYNVYVNDMGQIMLDPVETVPIYEAWLFKNKEAKESLERGLEESSKNKTKYLGSFARHSKE